MAEDKNKNKDASIGTGTSIYVIGVNENKDIAGDLSDIIIGKISKKIEK